MGLVDDLRGRHVYLDTNVFIYAISGFSTYAPVLRSLFSAIDSGEISAATSELALAEMLIIPFRHGSVEEEKRCRSILQPRPHLSVYPVSAAVLETMARFRAAHATMRTPDAIHVATAESVGCDIFLTNDRRLKVVSKVQIVQLSDAIE